MTKPTITLTDNELGLLALALGKRDALAYMGVLENPWCDDHDLSETDWVLTKLDRMRDDP